MSKGLIIRNIKCLVQTENVAKLKVCGTEMCRINTINDAFLFIIDGLIHDFGKMKDLKYDSFLSENANIDCIDASGKYVFPSFCDSHTHLVYAGSREIEISIFLYL